MAKAQEKTKTKEKPVTPKFGEPKGGCRPFWGTFFLVLAVLILVSLAHFEPGQSPHNTTNIAADNLVGAFGASVAYWSFYILGGAGWLLPFGCFYFSYAFFRFSKHVGIIKIVAVFACLVSAAALLSMQDTLFVDREPYPWGPGGIVGSLIYAPTQTLPSDVTAPSRAEEEVFGGIMKPWMGLFGSGLVLSSIYFLSLIVLLTSNMGEAFQKMFFHFGEWKVEIRNRRKEMREARNKAREAAAAEKERERERKKKEKEEKAKRAAKERLDQELAGDTATEVAAPPPGEGKRSVRPLPPKSQISLEPATEGGDREGSTFLPRPSAKALPGPQIVPPERELPKPKIIQSEALRKAPTRLPTRVGDYKFPTLDLLAKQELIPTDDQENHEETARALIHTLATFGVEATVDEIHVGPVITRFDILPAPGTKVSKIQGLENDIAMGLKALAVRILAPVPGKGCVGVEIPNRIPQPVCLREIIESEDWSNSRADIPIGLGKDVSGKPLVADLTKMPHLLIAGSTGSGKTVCINSIIASLLYHATPEELRFIMVDPKIVEMKVFNDLPHMLIPVVTEPKKVPGALKWLLAEMERRYQCFAAIGVRNIAGFHAYNKKRAEREKAEENAAAHEPNEIDGNLPEAVAPLVEPEDGMDIPKNLPYIVCIIDELADLMMVAPAEIETGIARLAQLARAAGIHLILATQRPSVNVITGVIKANLPSRISFKVASKVDSRTILDTGGADTLIGRGDMLFLPPGSSRLIRSQGAFVSDDEITAIVEYLKCNGPPVFAEDVQRQVDSGGEEEEGFEGGEEDDDLFQDALEVLRNTKRASTSMLQRRLRIGYNRAARIMELMEQRGVVGPENGSSPREILVDLESL
jgi:DNA segregation ATPase FtsK/SpoIIIE, S-DNA-T family